MPQQKDFERASSVKTLFLSPQNWYKARYIKDSVRFTKYIIYYRTSIFEKII